MSSEERRRRLAVRHRLIVPERTDDVPALTNDLVALHSSDPATVYLSCLVRMQAPTIGAVEAALYADRSVIRHHAMRRTLWVMTPEVTRLAHAACTAKIAATERRRTLKAMVESTSIANPAEWFDDGLAEITSLLRSDGPLGTRDIGRMLPHLVVPVVFGPPKSSATLNAHTKILQGAGFDGSIVRVQPTGTWMSSEYLWSDAAEWFGGPISGLEIRPAAAELVRLYLLRFGPCTETDLRWWFGETATLIRNALADLEAVELSLDDGSTGWLAPGDDEPTADVQPWVRLLPGLDPTPMGWKERDWYLQPEHVGRLFDRFGNAGPTIWADGRVVGGWIQRPDGSIIVDVLEPLGGRHQHLLDEAVEEMEQMLYGTVIKPRFPSNHQKALLVENS
jgi:hypothetical protein